jgi:hypothetical protein
LYTAKVAGVSLVAGLALACGPRAHIPALVSPSVEALDSRDTVAMLARNLAPILFQQADEWFALERVVAVAHPAKRLIAYHLLWRDDVHGSWIPFTVPTDQEIVWVGYDSTRAPVDVWTYWHGTMLHSSWQDRGPVEIDVQWGKHGLLPRHIVESDLPASKKLNSFYAMTWLGLPDIWLGNLTRKGPWCFCRGYGRYRRFDQVIALATRIDVVVRATDASKTLAEVFGKPYSRKPQWP